MEDWPKNTVKNNWAMRSGILQGSSGAGSLQRHLTNITSMLEPHITLSMSKAVTKMAGVQREFLRLGHDVARAYSHLKAREKTLVMDFIKEAYVKGIWYNTVNQLDRKSTRLNSSH